MLMRHGTRFQEKLSVREHTDKPSTIDYSGRSGGENPRASGAQGKAIQSTEAKKSKKIFT